MFTNAYWGKSICFCENWNEAIEFAMSGSLFLEISYNLNRFKLQKIMNC